MKGSFKVVLVFKVVILFIFSSEYNTDLFQPFVESFIAEGFQNPWQFYLETGLNLDSFPYHPFMLFLLSPFAALSSALNIAGIFKIPLLLADLGIYFILIKLYPNKLKNINLFYFLNPIIIYAIYIHSQLDIIPTAILLYAVFLITRKKYILSSLIIGLALATKIHIIIALPLIFFYLYKTENFKTGLSYFFISIITFLLFDLPFVFSDGFVDMVLLNTKQSILFDSFYTIGTVKILLPIASILMIFLHFFNQKKVNHDLLFFYFGILFTATIFFIYPSPAWYVWMIPFISMYFIKNYTTKNVLLYIGFSLSYLIFFVFFSVSDYHDVLFLGRIVDFKISDKTLANISFTVLEMTLIALMYAFYKHGIKSNSIYKKQSNLVIGIGGDSGVGKTTLYENLKLIFGYKILQLEGDGEHKWERTNENWKKFTHLDPKANHIHKQSDAILSLKNNKDIYRSEYNHTSGEFTEPKIVKPTEFIVISGLHPFYLPKLRKSIDFKVYIDTDETLRRHWKILRDTEERGYTIDKIQKQIESRMGDAEKYIYPQKEFSDMIVNYHPVNSFILGSKDAIIVLGLKLTFDANVHVEDILDDLQCEYLWDYNNDLKSQFIELKQVPTADFENLARKYIENIEEIIISDAEWKQGYEGLIQLILLKMISEKLKENDE